VVKVDKKTSQRRDLNPGPADYELYVQAGGRLLPLLCGRSSLTTQTHGTLDNPSSEQGTAPGADEVAEGHGDLLQVFFTEAFGRPQRKERSV
jgi:hypothetical protein